MCLYFQLQEWLRLNYFSIVCGVFWGALEAVFFLKKQLCRCPGYEKSPLNEGTEGIWRASSWARDPSGLAVRIPGGARSFWVSHFGKWFLPLPSSWHAKNNNAPYVNLVSNMISQSKVVEETMGISSWMTQNCILPPSTAHSRYSADNSVTPNSKNLLQFLDCFLSSCWQWAGK